jgi:hypothetical protein
MGCSVSLIVVPSGFKARGTGARGQWSTTAKTLPDWPRYPTFIRRRRIARGNFQRMDIIHEVTPFLAAAKTAIEVIKAAITLLPKGSKSEEAQEQIERAEKALKASEGAAAKALGYKICQCTFPPQIMLWKEAERAHVCPNSTCGRKISKTSPVGTRVRRSSWMA